MNVVIYARYSSDKQTEQSIEGQRKACLDYAKRNNYVVIGEYIDRALSGKSDNRQEFQRLISDSTKKHFQAVLVYSVDRFGRNLHQSIENEYKLQKNDVALISATESFADNPAGRMHRNIMMTFAQFYSDELAQKVTRGMNINAEKCLSNGGTIPFGFKVVNKKYQIDEETAPYVRKIFEMYADGKRIIDITDYLNTQQVKTSRGADFNNSSLHTMLSNKKYIGVYRYGDIEIPDGIPRIISDELFYKVADVLVKNKKYAGRSKAKAEYLLTTKLFCGHCKSLMVGVSGQSSTRKAYNYYSCNNTRLKPKICNKKAVSKDRIEDLVIKKCLEILTDENIEKIADEVVAVCEREKDNSNLKWLNKRLKENKKQTANLLESLKLCDIDSVRKSIFEEIDQMQKAHTEIEKEMAIELSQHINLTVREIKFFLTDLKNGDINSIKHRRTLINVFVNAIYLFDDKITFIFNAGDTPVTIDEVLFDDIMKDSKQAKSSYAKRFASPITSKGEL